MELLSQLRLLKIVVFLENDRMKRMKTRTEKEN